MADPSALTDQKWELELPLALWHADGEWLGQIPSLGGARFENTQWREVKQMQSVWLHIGLDRLYDNTHEKASE